MDDTVIGDRAVVEAGAVLGMDGFGYVFDGKSHRKIPQVGNVVIGEGAKIGACSCVDRAATASTLIGDYTELGHMVMVGHNSKVGSHCHIGDQSGLTGSSVVGNNCTIGYQCGLAYIVSLCIYQIGTLLTGGGFGVGTAVAFVLVAVFLYLLFRPYKESNSLKVNTKSIA